MIWKKGWQKKGYKQHDKGGMDVTLRARSWGTELINERLKKNQITWIDQIELVNKENEMLEGCVQMKLFTQDNNLTEVTIVDMCIYTEQSSEDQPYCLQECGRKWCSSLLWEHTFIIQKALNPTHQQIDVIWCTNSASWLSVASRPLEWVSSTCAHWWASCSCAEFCQSSIKHIDLIVKVNSYAKQHTHAWYKQNPKV